MRTLLCALCAFATVAAIDASAAPKKKTRRPPAAAAAPATAAPVESAPAAAEPTSGPTVRGPTRIDFDDRLIQGQTNKSGAVYLYDRKELKVRSMVKQRENFRDEIIGSLYDN